MKSVYVWEGKLRRDEEHLLLIKTLPEKFDELEKFITANHSYETTEIIAVETEKLNDSYLAWMKEIFS